MTSPDCEKIRALFSDRLDGTLPEADARRMDRHLSGCPDCRKEWEQMQAMKTLLKESPQLTPPESFYTKILEQTTRKEEPSGGFEFPYFKVLAFASIFGIAGFAILRKGDREVMRMAPLERKMQKEEASRQDAPVFLDDSVPVAPAAAPQPQKEPDEYSVRSIGEYSSPQRANELKAIGKVKGSWGVEKPMMYAPEKKKLGAVSEPAEGMGFAGSGAYLSRTVPHSAISSTPVTGVARDPETWQMLWRQAYPYAKVEGPAVNFSQQMALVVYSAHEGRAVRIENVEYKPDEIAVSYRIFSRPATQSSASVLDHRLVPKDPRKVTFRLIP